MAQNLQKYLLQAALVLIACSLTFACHGTLLATGITDADRSIILQEHNRLRQTVATGRYPGQPAAENMREMVWDDELAARAQQWADNCQFRHDPARTINRFTMGQNLAIIWSTAPLASDDGNFASRIQSWFNEVQKYSFGDAWSPKTGHYSQLVWGETSLVGCGYSEYKDSTKYNKLYVCNYGPGGNVVGYSPYQVGKPSCSAWGMNPSPRYQGLCSAPGTTSAAGINANTIETYEYKQTSSIYNNKQTAYSTQFSQPAPPSSSSSSYHQQAPSVQSSPVPSSIPSSYQHTTEASLYNLHKKNKLEAYRPSSAEFKKSVFKHTLLRTSLDEQQKETKYQDAYQQPQQQEQQQQQATPDIYVTVEEEPQVPTSKPATRGWSLLTWRG